MLQCLFYLSDNQLDKVISSYGIVEELHNNNDYLKESIELAMEISGSPICYISLLDSERQYIISSEGMIDFPLLKKDSICKFTVQNKKLTIIDDISCDSKTCNLEVAKGKNTYYAGFPLMNSENIAFGSLCIMDTKERSLNNKQLRILQIVSNTIVEKFETRRRLIKLIKDINKNFEPAECSDFHCLSSELAHLQSEIIRTKKELELQQEKLSMSNQNLSSFAHRIAHDIKAPLRSINAFSQLIERNNSEVKGTSDDSYFNYINSSVTQLNRMIDNLLSIAEFKTNVSPTTISVSQLIESIEVLLFQEFKQYNVKLIKPQVDVQLFGYESLLKQLFQNLISNSLKYNDPNKDAFIEVEFELLENSIKCSIIDNGVGISAEKLETIFEPFKRVSEKEVEGLGIGLDTCKMIVEDLGGKLSVESELGKGSTFSFEIPAGFNLKKQ